MRGMASLPSISSGAPPGGRIMRNAEPPSEHMRTSDTVAVSEAEIARAMFFIWERAKIVIEPTGALGVAGLFKQSAQWRGHEAERKREDE